MQAYAQCAANQEVGQDIILPDMTHSHSHSALKCGKGLEEMRDFHSITIPIASFIDTYYMPDTAFSFSHIASAVLAIMSL